MEPSATRHSKGRFDSIWSTSGDFEASTSVNSPPAQQRTNPHVNHERELQVLEKNLAIAQKRAKTNFKNKHTVQAGKRVLQEQIGTLHRQILTLEDKVVVLGEENQALMSRVDELEASHSGGLPADDHLRQTTRHLVEENADLRSQISQLNSQAMRAVELQVMVHQAYETIDRQTEHVRQIATESCQKDKNFVEAIRARVLYATGDLKQGSIIAAQDRLQRYQSALGQRGESWLGLGNEGTPEEFKKSGLGG